MGCSNCSSANGGIPSGCGSKGHCLTGGCNKMNTYDWVSVMELSDPSIYHIIEVSFKGGSHKEFFINEPSVGAITGDMVVVETSSGYDVGQVSLSGDLVRLQMKKKYIQEEKIQSKVLRIANQRDLEKLEEARNLEKETMVKARVIARTLGIDMKLGDVAYQGDKKKATFYYTAEGRVDFRELVKEYARIFKIKIEMRQIGARQESARIGGIGSCGRELCCSTWLSDFKSVNTAAARYQNIAINQLKLSGQCGRLKCCLNYELDTYMEALEDFPEDAEVLQTKLGTARLVKTDIFKGLLYYAYDNEKIRNTFIPISKERAKAIKKLNKSSAYPEDLVEASNTPKVMDRDSENIEHDYEDVTGLIELKQEPRRKNRNKNKKPSGQREGNTNPNQPQNNGPKNPTENKVRHQRQPNPNQTKLNNPPEAKPENPKPISSSHEGNDGKTDPRKKFHNKNKRFKNNKNNPPKNNNTNNNPSNSN
ncbi:MAG: regulatory iron-sulfur-containing complex subunit RicT [Saprospiraceae bacterium]